MIQVTPEELTNLLMNVKLGEFINIETFTELKMNKGRGSNKNPYYEKVLKHSKKNVRLLPDYEKRIQNKTGDENFKSKGNWFHHVSPCVVKHNEKNEYYLMYEWFEKIHVKNEYIFNDEIIDKEVLKPWEIKKTKSDINVNVVKIKNIKHCSFQGNKYEVI